MSNKLCLYEDEDLIIFIIGLIGIITKFWLNLNDLLNTEI